MKVLLLVPLLATLATRITTTKAQCPTLLWSDEFEGNKLDSTKWTNMVGNGCDLGQGMCGWGNNEWQYYTPGSENIQVSDGTLKIQAKKELVNGSPKYTSARIRSLGKADFDLTTNLRFEARIKVPKSSMGLWPAFWMMPSQTKLNKWPLGGEIDIMEFIGKEPNNTYGVMHYGNQWNDKSQKGGLVKLPQHAGESFHVFAVEKTDNQMTWFFDGKQYQNFTDKDVEPKFQWPFEAEFHFILNLAIGGNWPGYPDPTTQFPNQLEVDYVRVYDLDSSAQPTPQIEGDSLVRIRSQEEQYCVSVGSSELVASIDWSVPNDASFSSLQETPQQNCILVNFGTQSGFVQANIAFTCGQSHELKLPVHVQDFYGAEFSFLGPDSNLDQATYTLSTGNYTVANTGETPPSVIIYQRSLLEVYDHIDLSTAAIPNPNLYVQAAKKFYMDAMSQTAAPCTGFWIQLEDSSLATPDNYPIGRHSRYLSFLPKDFDWQRLEFDFYDRPDPTTFQVDRIVLLIDSLMERSDVYYLRNLVSAVAGGCDNEEDAGCEPLSTNSCQAPAKSEAGACTDGHNNDGVGWNGDGPMDCEDSDCWGLDPACMAATTPPAALVTSPAAVEICNDGVDNDENGFIDCDDLACADSPLCHSNDPSCDASSGCADLGLVGQCCPTAQGVYLDCCGAVDLATPAESQVLRGLPAGVARAGAMAEEEVSSSASSKTSGWLSVAWWVMISLIFYNRL